MEAVFSVTEATQKLYTGLAEATGWKYLKSSRTLKKTVEDLVFEINFHSSQWNFSGQSVEVNADFYLKCKSYGKLDVDTVVALISYRPDNGYWYDISTEEKFNHTFQELNNAIQNTAVNLCAQFENDYLSAAECLFREHFEEYRVSLDFIADKLGVSTIKAKAQEIYDGLSDEMKRQVSDYKNGIKNMPWMINRSNLKYIVDNDLIEDL